MTRTRKPPRQIISGLKTSQPLVWLDWQSRGRRFDPGQLHQIIFHYQPAYQAIFTLIFYRSGSWPFTVKRGRL